MAETPGDLAQSFGAPFEPANQDASGPSQAPHAVRSRAGAVQTHVPVDRRLEPRSVQT